MARVVKQLVYHIISTKHLIMVYHIISSIKSHHIKYSIIEYTIPQSISIITYHIISHTIFRGYYMAMWRYGFYLRVLISLTSEQSDTVGMNSFIKYFTRVKNNK